MKYFILQEIKMGGLRIVPMYKFIAAIMAYSLLSFLIFTVVYGLLGMQRHFNVGDPTVSNWEHAVWHAWSVQSTAMDEVTPKTRAGRIAQGVQVGMSWLPMILLLAPWNIEKN